MVHSASFFYADIGFILTAVGYTAIRLFFGAAHAGLLYTSDETRSPQQKVSGYSYPAIQQNALRFWHLLCFPCAPIFPGSDIQLEPVN